MYTNALHAYETVERATVSGRETEARVLGEAARKLRTCQKLWNNGRPAEALDDALTYTQRIWTIFQTELGKPDNPLPDALKLDLLRLSRFIDSRIFEIVSDPTPDKLSILIAINENVAAGLRGE